MFGLKRQSGPKLNNHANYGTAKVKPISRAQRIIERNRDPVFMDKVVKLYKKIGNQDKVAKKLGCGVAVVNRILRMRGVTIQQRRWG